jgi:hypothetical protein
MKNVGTFDRLLRALLAEISLLTGFFWVGGAWQLVLYLLALVLLVQAATGICGLYGLLGVNTCERIKRKSSPMVAGSLILLLVVAVAGSYASAALTKKILMDDLEGVKEPYNLALLETGLERRNESVYQYDRLAEALKAFDSKYSEYRPLAIKFDRGFSGDMQNASAIVASVRDDVHLGNMTEAHRRLQDAGPVIHRMVERSGLQ